MIVPAGTSPISETDIYKKKFYIVIFGYFYRITSISYNNALRTTCLMILLYVTSPFVRRVRVVTCGNLIREDRLLLLRRDAAMAGCRGVGNLQRRVKGPPEPSGRSSTYRPRGETFSEGFVTIQHTHTAPTIGWATTEGFAVYRNDGNKRHERDRRRRRRGFLYFPTSSLFRMKNKIQTNHELKGETRRRRIHHICYI